MVDGLDVRWLGRIDYPEALDLQMRQVAARRAGEVLLPGRSLAAGRQERSIPIWICGMRQS